MLSLALLFQKNAFDSMHPSQIIHHRPNSTAPTPPTNITSPTLSDFTQAFGEEAPPTRAPSDTQEVNVSGKKQPAHSITHTAPKSSKKARSGTVSHKSLNTKKIKNEGKPAATSVPTTQILSSGYHNELGIPGIPFTPTVFSCLQPGALFPTAFPLQFPSMLPNTALQMLARDSQPVPFVQPAMSPIAISIPFPLQSNPSTQSSTFPTTGTSNTPSGDTAESIKSKKTDDLCSAVDKQIETLAETLSVSPNDNPPFPPPVNQPHSKSVPSAVQLGSPTASLQPSTHLFTKRPPTLPSTAVEAPTPSCGNTTNSISGPAKLPHDASTQELQASPSTLASTVLPSPSENSNFYTSLNTNIPIANVTMVTSSETAPTNSCERTTDTSSQQLFNASLSHSSASSSFTDIAKAPTKTKSSSKDRPTKEKKRPKNPHSVIQDSSSTLESPVYPSSKKLVCQVSTDATDEMALKKLGEDTVTSTLSLPADKRQHNSDLSPLQTSLASSGHDGASYSTALAETTVVQNTIGSLFPNLLQGSSNDRTSATTAFLVPNSMPLPSAGIAVSTTPPKGRPSLSALPLSSSQQSRAVTPSVLQGTRKTAPISSTTTTVISTKSRLQQSEGKTRQGGPRSAVSATSKPAVQASSASVLVASQQGSIPTALPFFGVSNAPLHPFVMATSNKSITPSGPVFSSSIPPLPFSALHTNMLPTAFIPQFSLPTVPSVQQERTASSPSIVTAGLASTPSDAHSSDNKQNIPKKAQELNLASRKQQETAGDKVAEPATTFPHIVEAFSGSKQRKRKVSSEKVEDPLTDEKGKGKSKHSKKYRKKSARSSISSTDGASIMHIAANPMVQDRFQMVGTELRPMMSVPFIPPDEAPLLTNHTPLVSSTPKCFGDAGKGSVGTRLPKQHAAQSPVASLVEGRAASTGSPTLLMNPFVTDLGDDPVEIERLYLHNLALLKQQEQYTKMLEQHLLKLQRESKSSRKPSKVDVYRQFLSFVVEPNCVPDIPISIPGFNPESSHEIELKGSFDKPILSSTHDVYASFGHT